MKRIIAYIVCLFINFSVICNGKETLQYIVPAVSNSQSYEAVMKRDFLCLMMAYPEYISGVVKGKDGSEYLVLKSGRHILYDDRMLKSPEQKLNNPDLQDMMEQIYPLTDIKSLMDMNYDPGRVRVYELLKEVYGGSREQIQSNLVNIRAGYKGFLFNGNNKAGEALKEAMKELVTIAQSNSKVSSSAFPINGTFNYRLISGTNRLSPHSFGIAIDLARDKRDYWKWATREQGNSRLNSYPREIVKVFEKHNFIWGGKWGHFDILHFEYRPELILKSRYFSNSPIAGKQWYEGLETENAVVKEYIKMIDEALK